jgi:hypothetical protein
VVLVSYLADLFAAGEVDKPVVLYGFCGFISQSAGGVLLPWPSPVKIISPR